ncbi:Chitosanase [Burkholderiaceae bacterium]|nr:Chitosanase [Burkholderiaceae bacterium]
MHRLTISCDECAPVRARLEQHGYRVDDCEPQAPGDGACVIAFEQPAATARARRSAHAAAAPLTPSQAAAAEAIVNIFETGEVLGVYGQVTVIPGDTGHLTYGRSQTTLGSGNLHELLQRYCANPGARFGARLQPQLPRFAAKDLTLDHDTRLHNLLRACADDRVMRELQDSFFDEAYWRPALRGAERAGIHTPLGVAVVYDGHVHGSWGKIRDSVDSQFGTVPAIGEEAWVSAYVETRRAWLADSPRADLRTTVYRMDALRRLIDLDQWGLALPLVVRGREISADALAAAPPGCYDGPQPGARAIALQQPLARGLDVRLVQLGLSDRGMDIRADGVFGPGSSRTVKAFQVARGLPVTGVADIALISSLVDTP